MTEASTSSANAANPLPVAAGGSPLELVPPRAESMGTRVLRGATWFMIQSLIAQVLAFGTKVAVTRLLSKEQVGVAALALSICSMLAFLQLAPMSDVLVQRQAHFARWAKSAFWLSAVVVGVMLVTGGVAAVVAHYLFKGDLVPLLVIVGILPSVFIGLSAVWTADLTRTFNFRAVAVIGTVGSLCTTALTVAMAAGGLGAWSLVAPPGAAALVMLILTMRKSRFHPGHRLLVHRWPFLIRDVLTLSVAGFFSSLTMQADNFFIGIYHPHAELGVYAIAYTASFQFVQLASRSLRGVVLPAFSSINAEPARRDQAFMRIVQMTAFVSMPACILAIPAAPAGVRLLFSSAWDDAAPMMQIFLCTMPFVVVGGISMSVIQARQLLRRLLIFSICAGVTFCAMVWPVAALGSTTAVAIAVSIFYGLTGIITPLIAAYPCSVRTGVRFVVVIVLPSALAGVAAAGAWFCCQLTPLAPTSIAWAVLALAIGTAVYGVLAFIFMRGAFDHMMERLRVVIVERRRTGGTAA